MRRFMCVLAATCGLIAILGATPATAKSIDAGLRKLVASTGEVAPIVRIGLADEHRVIVASRSGIRIVDPESGKDLWKKSYDGEVVVVAEGGPSEGAPSVYRIQVGAFTSDSAADAEKRRLEKQSGAVGVVHHDPDRGIWRVRLGRADDRQALGPLMDRLRESGLQGLWIAEEPAEIVSDVRLRLVDESFDSRVLKGGRLAVIPVSRHPISVQQTTYRGIVELRVSPYGTIRPVNWIGLEHYLRGVVPAELGPEVWPELHALKAQAVAARTYVWRNRGQFSDEGFDLCATPRCQVYSGASAEHPLSDRAILSTTGEVMVSKGRPIVALYTATCGGHTEDGGSIFPEHDESYLKGVPCRAEGAALATQRGVVPGRRIRPVHDEAGADVTRDWTLLEASGVAGVAARAEAVLETLQPDDLRRWTGELSRLAGLSEPDGPPRPVTTLGEAAAALLTDMEWIERSEVLLFGEDLPALLRGSETRDLPPEQARALAYLTSVDALRPFADGKLHIERSPSRARFAPALVRIGESYDAFGLRSAVVAGVGESSLRMVRGKGELRLALSADVALFSMTGGRPAPTDRLDLWPGDRVRYRLGTDGAIDFLELRPPVRGVTDDRSSRVYSWEVRKTRREIEAAINRRVSVGRLEQLRAVRRGVSGRIVELEISGSKGSTVVKGFDVRRLLDLRDSLLVFEIQRDSEGAVEAVVFAGKGWGHGVGMCQVGAYGMALRGADYREILTHYYTGAAVEFLEADGG